MKELSPEVILLVESRKRQLVSRAKMARLNPDQIFHIVEGGYIFVICNPVVAHDELHNEFGPTGEFVDRRNVTMWTKGLRFEGNKVIEECGLYPIIAPWLLMRLNLDGSLNADGGDVLCRDIENRVVEGNEKALHEMVLAMLPS